MKMIDRIRKFQERNQRSTSTGSNFNNNDKIFFDLSEGTHRIRLVGDWVCVHSHWIAPTQFSRVNLYSENAFKGENRLRKMVNCPDFDIDTELLNSEKKCTICKLHAAANDILYSCNDLDKKQKTFLENIAYDTRFSERVFFLCIDRDNPEVSPGKKGFKIIEFPKSLMSQWMQLVGSNPDLECTSVEEGVDFNVIKTKDGGNRSQYLIQYVMAGTKICQTPLTDEEKTFERLDIKKIMCKMPDQGTLYEKLLPEFREILDDQESGESSSVPEKEPEFSEEDDETTVPF